MSKYTILIDGKEVSKEDERVQKYFWEKVTPVLKPIVEKEIQIPNLLEKLKQINIDKANELECHFNNKTKPISTIYDEIIEKLQ